MRTLTLITLILTLALYSTALTLQSGDKQDKLQSGIKQESLQSEAEKVDIQSVIMLENYQIGTKHENSQSHLKHKKSQSGTTGIQKHSQSGTIQKTPQNHVNHGKSQSGTMQKNSTIGGKQGERGFLVELKTKTFDVRSDRPIPPPEDAKTQPHIYVIHTHPKYQNLIQQEFNQLAKTLSEHFNSTLYGPVPHNSFFLYGKLDVVDFLKKQIKFFDWISFVHPDWRKDDGLDKPQKVHLSVDDLKETDLLTSLLVSFVPTLDNKQFRIIADRIEKDLKDVVHIRDVLVSHQDGPLFRISTGSEQELIRTVEFLSQIPIVQFIERAVKHVPRLKFMKPFIFDGIQAGMQDVDSYYNGDVNENKLFTSFVPVTGYGEVIGIADTGLANPQHCFLYSLTGLSVTSWNGNNPTNVVTLAHPRVKQYYGFKHNILGDASGHGTFMATIINANPPFDYPQPGQFRGIARGARLAVMDLNSFGTTLNVSDSLYNMYDIAYRAGANVYCNSFSGYDPSLFEATSAYKYSAGYNAQTRDIDKFMYDKQDMLIVVPAGFVKCSQAGSPLGSLGMSKNALVVGASMNVPGLFDHVRNLTGPTEFDVLAKSPSFVSDTLKSPYSISNVCPTGEIGGRIKPDLYAPGTYVMSGNAFSMFDTSCKDPNGFLTDADRVSSVGDVYYDTANHGPSTATAVVSALAALVREYLKLGYFSTGYLNPSIGFQNPSAALVKALLINGAVPLPNGEKARRFSFNRDDPNGCNSLNDEVSTEDLGFGYVRLSTSLLSPSRNFKMHFPGHDENRTSSFGDPQILGGATDSYSYCAFYSQDQKDMINITLAWMDPVSVSGTSSSIINALKLKVTYGDVIYWGNGVDGGDTNNTVQRVRLPALNASSKANTKDVYIEVIAPSTLQNLRQSYALVVTGWLSYNDCSVALTPDGYSQSNLFTTAPAPKVCNQGDACYWTQDAYSLATIIIISITAVIVSLSCCCILLCYTLAFVYSPMRKKAGPTTNEIVMLSISRSPLPSKENPPPTPSISPSSDSTSPIPEVQATNT